MKNHHRHQKKHLNQNQKLNQLVVIPMKVARQQVMLKMKSK
jgi:hypothetical protein